MDDTKRTFIHNDDGVMLLLAAVAERARRDLERAAKTGDVASMPADKRLDLAEAGALLIDLAQGVKHGG